MGKEHKAQHNIAVIGGVFAILAAIIGGIFLLINTYLEKKLDLSTPTAQVNASSTDTNEISEYFYDDFNSDGDFRQDYWSWGKLENDGCSVTQQDGFALFTNEGTNDSSILCLIAAQKMRFEDVGSMEANIFAKNGATGDFSLGIIEFSQGSFEEGSTNWVFQCGIKQDPNTKYAELFFYVNSNYPEGDADVYTSIPARTEKIYRMKLEIIPSNNKILCYADGNILDEYQDEKVKELSQKDLMRKLLSFWSAKSQGTYYMDNVQLLSPK